jgi:hypothetical protein
LIHFDCGLCIVRLRERGIPFAASGHCFGSLSHKLREGRQTIRQRFCLFETPPLVHGALLSLRGRRERNRAFSSPMNTSGRSVVMK